MKLTLQLKLVPTAEQHTALLDTMRAFNAAASYAAEVGFRDHVFSQQAIHVRCYRELRNRFGLSAQMAVRAIGKVVETFKRDKKVCPIFRADGAMTYDERILGWKGPAHVSLLTLQRREIVAMVYGEYQAGFLTRLKGQVDLVYRDGTFTSMPPLMSLKRPRFSPLAFGCGPGYREPCHGLGWQLVYGR